MTGLRAGCAPRSRFLPADAGLMQRVRTGGTADDGPPGDPDTVRALLLTRSEVMPHLSAPVGLSGRARGAECGRVLRNRRATPSRRGEASALRESACAAMTALRSLVVVWLRLRSRALFSPHTRSLRRGIPPDRVSICEHAGRGIAMLRASSGSPTRSGRLLAALQAVGRYASTNSGGIRAGFPRLRSMHTHWVFARSTVRRSCSRMSW